MRIISGKFKGKKLIQPLDKNTRPLKDITKESIFNLIVHSKFIDVDFEKSIILDLFAGSGSFGIECLSRYSRHVTFIENYKPAVNTLKKNINLLNLSNKISKDFYDKVLPLCTDGKNINKRLFRYLINFFNPIKNRQKINKILQQ